MTDQLFQCGGLPGASSWGPQGPAWMVTWRHLRPGSEGGSSQCRASFCFVILFFFFFTCEGTDFCLVGRAKASVTSLPSKLPQVFQVFEERPDTERCIGACMGAGTDITVRGFGLALLSFEKSHLQF